MHKYQVTLADLIPEELEQARRRKWQAPTDRGILRLSELEAEVRLIYEKGQATGRQTTLEFLKRFHYMHQNDDAKEPNFTLVHGVFLRCQLAGIVAMNPPAAGVWRKFWGDNPMQQGMLAITRTCMDDRTKEFDLFNIESFGVAGALRLTPQLQPRWHTVIAQSDLGVTDPQGKVHIGGIYMAANGFWAGHSESSQWRGFLNPETGARVSRKNGGVNRRKEDCPRGWIVEPAAKLTNFLWFCGPAERMARENLLPEVKVSIREGIFPVWRHPSHVSKSAIRAYSEADKALRAGGVA